MVRAGKRRVMRACAAALALAVACALAWVPAAAAAAAPAVVYDGAAHEWRGRGLGETGDVLAGCAELGDLMPGDAVSTSFTVEAQNLGVGTTLYLKSAYDEADVRALGQVRVSVAADGTVVAEGTLAEHGELADGVRLASHAAGAGGSTDVTVQVEIPVSAGNELMCSVHEIEWVFVAAEDGGARVEQPSDGLLPTTGDAAAWAPVAAAAAGVAVLAFAALSRGRGESRG